VFLHRLEQRGLGLGRRAIDLVRQHHVGEDRPVHESERPLAGGEILLDDVSTGDVARHQVRGELDPIERQVERFGDGLDHERLGQSGHADQQGMPAREDRGENAVHDLVLAHDPVRHLRLEPGNGSDQPLQLPDVVVRCRLRLRHGHRVAE
jgi:hypothetical protein